MQVVVVALEIVDKVVPADVKQDVQETVVEVVLAELAKITT